MWLKRTVAHLLSGSLSKIQRTAGRECSIDRTSHKSWVTLLIDLEFNRASGEERGKISSTTAAKWDTAVLADLTEETIPASQRIEQQDYHPTHISFHFWILLENSTVVLKI